MPSSQPACREVPNTESRPLSLAAPQETAVPVTGIPIMLGFWGSRGSKLAGGNAGIMSSRARIGQIKAILIPRFGCGWETAKPRPNFCTVALAIQHRLSWSGHGTPLLIPPVWVCGTGVCHLAFRSTFNTRMSQFSPTKAHRSSIPTATKWDTQRVVVLYPIAS